MSAIQTNGKSEASTNSSNAAAPNENSSKVPDWFNANIFENLLKENVPEYKKIMNFKAYSALEAGENFLGIMLRTEIDAELQDGTTKSLSYMCKVVPTESQIIKELLEKHNVFDIEHKMYHEVIPELEQMYQDAGKEVKFGAHFYKLPIVHDHICMEDLRQRDFKNANRLEGLDMDHMHCVLRKLAQWHAASAVRVTTKGQYADIIVKGLYREDQKPMLEHYNESMLKPFRKSLQTFDVHEKHLKSVDHLIANYTDILLNTAANDPTEFNVLNHGDLWCNNIMFQYDAFGKIKETYFVDYQLPKYGSPAQDLFFVILSSAKLELKLKHFDYFIKFYHDNLFENLKLLKYSKALPTLKDIHAMLFRYGIWGFNPVLGDLASVLLDPNDNANLDNFFGENSDGSDLKILMYSNPRYRKHIEVILPWLHNRGALDC